MCVKYFSQLVKLPKLGNNFGLLVSALLGIFSFLGLLYSSQFPAAAAQDIASTDFSPPLENETNIGATQISARQVITQRDIVVVFDVSGSMEYETVCYDCWARTDPNNPDYPNNGHFNPLPYNAAWADTDSDGIADFPQSIPASPLCIQAPAAHTDSGFDYLVHEAELYSREVGNWDLDVRTQGQGFWVLQRGSRNPNNPNSPAENGDYQGNQAGNPGSQSSNVCNPAVLGIDCTLGGTDDICDSSDGGYSVDCSAYIKAHLFATYTQPAGQDSKLLGGAYDLTCWTGGNDACWDINPTPDPTRPLTSQVPYVEYDFDPTWAGGQTHIWLRAVGGGDRAYQWNGLSPSSLSNWKDRVYWQVGDLTNPVQENSGASAISGGDRWRDNRATNGEWDWIKLGSIATPAGQETLRIYQGSAGYKIDKIVFTNDPAFSPPSILNQNSGKGPAATPGSATRESCNVCNPAFGHTVGPSDCGCPINAAEAQAYNASGAYGSGGSACTNVITQTNQLTNDLFHGLDPLRSAQEAVKNFARRLDPQFDQIGVVPFTTNVVNGSAAEPSRSKLQCLQWAENNLGDARECYDPTFTTTPLSYTFVLEAVERQWPQTSTDIAEGLREGLEELGVDAAGNPGTVDNSCSTTLNDGKACDRLGAAAKVLILLTDGSPNQNPGSCNASNGRPDLWNGDVGEGDPDYECALFFAKEAADAGVTVHTIGLGPGVNPDLLTAIATGRDPHSTSGIGEEFLFEACNGEFFNAAQLTDLDAIFEAIDNTPPECDYPIEHVTLSGPTGGLTDLAHTFTATVEPSSATLPVTYTWQATEQTLVIQSNGLSNTVAFTWNTPGTKAITVTAENVKNSLSETHTIEVTAAPVPPTGVTIDGSATGLTQTSYAFTATVSPISATQPLTYVWQGTDQTPATHPDGLSSDTVSFTWNASGTQTIVVTATNAAGTVSDEHTIVISLEGQEIYLPIILKSSG